MEVRKASRDDLDRTTETITLAFADDPVWGPALRAPDGGSDHLAGYWRRFVASSMDQGGAWLADGGAAVSIWIPPGGEELSARETAALERDAVVMLGETRARELIDLFARFEAEHPHDEPHAYLSLLATHPEHRGRGIGQALLADNLARWDVAGSPAYLESTNPANDHRYARLGFRRVGGFHAMRDDAPITTMWRDVAGPAAVRLR